MPAKVDHDDRRRKLLAASFHIFASEGYAACTMRGLARSLGVSTGTLYHYFDGKEAVFVAMFRQLNDEIVEAATQELQEDPLDAGPLAVLLTFLAGHIDQLQAVIRIGLEYHRHHDDPSSRDWLASITRKYTEVFQNHLALDNPDDGRVVLSLLMGAVVHQLFDPAAVDLGTHMMWVQQALSSETSA